MLAQQGAPGWQRATPFSTSCSMYARARWWDAFKGASCLGLLPAVRCLYKQRDVSALPPGCRNPSRGLFVRQTRIGRTVALPVWIGGLAPIARAQTFVQLTDLGDGIGSRLTRSVTLARINCMLFSAT